MPTTEKRYPDWVQKQRTRGTTVKKKGDNYYLYKRTSKRVKGKKYPQPVDTYVGIITPDGVIRSGVRKVNITDIEVKEYGYSRALWQLCPEGWKKPLGDEWEDVLTILIADDSPETYLLKERTLKNKAEFHHSFPAQKASLSRRIYKEYNLSLGELDLLRNIYLVYLEKEPVVSRIDEEQKRFLEKYGISLEVR